MLSSLLQRCSKKKDLSLFHADKLLSKLWKYDAISWSVIISAHAKAGMNDQAIHLYHNLQNLSISPNGHVFVAILKACMNVAALRQGKQIHTHIIESGFESDVFVGNSLINMYAKCGSLEHARSVFERLSKRDVVTWNVMIAGYVQQCHHQEALKLFKRMQQDGINPNEITYLCILKVCSGKSGLDHVKLIHMHIVDSGFELGLSVGTTLVDMYSKCESVEDADRLFARLLGRNEVTWNAMLLGYALHRLASKAYQLFQQMQQEGIKPSQTTFLAILKACSSIANLDQGKRMHIYIIEWGFALNICVGNALVNMYAKCGSVDHASKVFRSLPKRDVVTWSAMIAGFSQQTLSQEAFQLFKQMEQEGIQPNQATYACILKACSSIPALEIIYCHAIERGFESHLSVGNALISMYGNWASLQNMRKVFETLSTRDDVTWNKMVAGYAQSSHFQAVFQLLQQMLRENFELNEFTSVFVLKACSSFTALNEGRLAHSHIIKYGLDLNVYVGSTLIDMYAKCGSIQEACNVFKRLLCRNVVTWNAMLAALLQDGYCNRAIGLLRKMQEEGLEPNNITIVCILKACSCALALDHGQIIHAMLIECGSEFNIFVGNSLINMYAKCGSLENAGRVFDCLPKLDTVTWNTMITGCVNNGQSQKALTKFQQMQQEGISPNLVTYICVLKACTSAAALDCGQLIHSQLEESGLELNIFVENAIINMYAKCGSLVIARKIFDILPKRDEVTWSAMIAGYTWHGLGHEAIQLFHKMQQEGIRSNQITFISILKACSSIAVLDDSKLIHDCIMQTDFKLNVIVCNLLIDMYIKCGRLEDACRLFEGLPMPDVVTWTAMIMGYASVGYNDDAFVLFGQMQQQGLEPNQVTFIVILKTCRSRAALDRGKLVHAGIMKNGFESDVNVGSTLIDMYAKCGSLKNACVVFDSLPRHNVVTWTAIIASFSQHCDYVSALQYFQWMQHEGFEADQVTMACLISVCSHLGLVNEGCNLLNLMRQDHGILPAFEHCNYLVDLLGRTGLLKDAEALLESMPFQSNILGWTSLLCHCRIHGNVKVGRQCFDRIIKIDGRNAAGYALMSNIFACTSMEERDGEMKDLGRQAHA